MLTKYFSSDELYDEKTGLICSIMINYKVFWGSAKIKNHVVDGVFDRIHYLKIMTPENEFAYFDIFNGKQIIVDKKYIDIPQIVFNGIRVAFTVLINGKTYWEQVFEHINFANKDEENYLVIQPVNYMAPPKFKTVKKPGRKAPIYIKDPKTDKILFEARSTRSKKKKSDGK